MQNRPLVPGQGKVCGVCKQICEILNEGCALVSAVLPSLPIPGAKINLILA